MTQCRSIGIGESIYDWMMENVSNIYLLVSVSLFLTSDTTHPTFFLIILISGDKRITPLWGDMNIISHNNDNDAR